MLLLKFNPPPPLSRCVDSIFVQEDFSRSNYANRKPVKVLPSALAVIGIQYGQRMKLVEERNHSLLGSSGITGLQTRPKQYVSTGGIGTILITFKPGGLAAFTAYPIHEFMDANVDLDCIFPKHLVGEMESRVQEAANAAERVGIVGAFLCSQYGRKERDMTIVEAAVHIQQCRGGIPVERLAAERFVSKRTLERRFNSEIGMSPKKFANLVRFQHTIQLRKAGINYLDIIEQCSFSDHAHLAHDFKAFAGCSPETFFREVLQPELASRFNADRPDFAVSNTMYQ